jgi:hypothetical protein
LRGSECGSRPNSGEPGGGFRDVPGPGTYPHPVAGNDSCLIGRTELELENNDIVTSLARRSIAVLPDRCRDSECRERQPQDGAACARNPNPHGWGT